MTQRRGRLARPSSLPAPAPEPEPMPEPWPEPERAKLEVTRCPDCGRAWSSPYPEKCPECGGLLPQEA